MDRRMAIISGAAFAGVLGAGIIISGMTGAFSKPSNGSSSNATPQILDTGSLVPLPANGQGSFAGGREGGEHSGSRYESGDD